MNTQGIEFSIARCVEEMDCVANPMPFFLVFFFSFYFIMRSWFLGTRSFMHR